MLKSSKVTDAYNKIERLYNSPVTPEMIQEIKRIITKMPSLIVSKAVDIAALNGIKILTPDIIAAFNKFMSDGAKIDKGCQSKIAIAKALNAFEYSEDDVFLAGAYYTQYEPVYGGSEDTAVDLRSECAFGLARINHPRALYILADLLMEKSEKVRAASAKALAFMGEPECEMMLRVKILAGDTNAALGECFMGLMAMAPRRSLEFVSRYLDDRDRDIMELAAIAIGNSHMPEALERLLKFWNLNALPSVRRSLLLPIALVRSDEAIAHLLDVLRDSDSKTTECALNALEMYKDDRYIHRIEDAVNSRANRKIHE